MSSNTNNRHSSQRTQKSLPTSTRKRTAAVLSTSDSEDSHQPTKRTKTVKRKHKCKHYPKSATNEKPKSTNKSNKTKKSNESAVDKTCPICFKTFKKEQIAKPKGCAHAFCLLCLQQWSKNTNTCPIDRKIFDSIDVHKNINNNTIVRNIPVETKKLFDDQEEEFSESESNDSFDWSSDLSSDFSDSSFFPLIDSDLSDSDSDLETGLFMLLALRFMSH